MNISVIICTKDRADDLYRLLECLAAQKRAPDEVIIIDASRNEKTKDMLEQKSDNLPLDVIYRKTDPGLTRQRNTGIGLSRGEYVFFFDDDVILEKEFIETICDTFHRSRGLGVGGITGRIVNIRASQRSWESLFKKVFFLSDFGKGRVKLSGLPSIKIDDEPGFVESLSGGCTAYLKEVFDQFRFDEKLKGYAYLEDVDFSYRVGKKYRLLYQALYGPEVR